MFNNAKFDWNCIDGSVRSRLFRDRGRLHRETRIGSRSLPLCRNNCDSLNVPRLRSKHIFGFCWFFSLVSRSGLSPFRRFTFIEQKPALAFAVVEKALFVHDALVKLADEDVLVAEYHPPVALDHAPFESPDFDGRVLHEPNPDALGLVFPDSAEIHESSVTPGALATFCSTISRPGRACSSSPWQGAATGRREPARSPVAGCR